MNAGLFNNAKEVKICLNCKRVLPAEYNAYPALIFSSINNWYIVDLRNKVAVLDKPTLPFCNFS